MTPTPTTITITPAAALALDARELRRVAQAARIAAEREIALLLREREVFAALQQQKEVTP